MTSFSGKGEERKEPKYQSTTKQFDKKPGSATET